jgi:hypothetical protein
MDLIRQPHAPTAIAPRMRPWYPVDMTIRARLVPMEWRRVPDYQGNSSLIDQSYSLLSSHYTECAKRAPDYALVRYNLNHNCYRK